MLLHLPRICVENTTHSAIAPRSTNTGGTSTLWRRRAIFFLLKQCLYFFHFFPQFAPVVRGFEPHPMGNRRGRFGVTKNYIRFLVVKFVVFCYQLDHVIGALAIQHEQRELRCLGPVHKVEWALDVFPFPLATLEHVDSNVRRCYNDGPHRAVHFLDHSKSITG